MVMMKVGICKFSYITFLEQKEGKTDFRFSLLEYHERSLSQRNMESMISEPVADFCDGMERSGKHFVDCLSLNDC